jgi:DNA polymerase-4
MPEPPCPPLNWLFVDMNGYFASVEQHLRPELRGRPVGVIPVESEGSCVIAASYEAKRFGVKTGTGVRDARRLCPGIELVRARPDVYVRVHHAVAESIDRWAPIHNAYSIDEWAIRLGRGQREPEKAAELGRAIKKQIHTDFSPALSCSVGIAPTRLLAKIASDLKKPDGLTVLSVADLPGKLAHCELEDLCGIGRGIERKLHRHGIRTVEELWTLSRRQAVAVWGSVVGGHWWAGFHGVDEPELPTRKNSMAHENILEPRLRTEAGARGILIRLTCRLGVRLRSEDYLAGGLAVGIDYVGEGEFSGSIELPLVQDTTTLLETLDRILARCTPMPRAPLKVGVTVFGLAPASQIAANLFEQAERPAHLSRTMDLITSRWGMSSLYFASMHDYRHHMDDKIAFGRIPAMMQTLDKSSYLRIKKREVL